MQTRLPDGASIGAAQAWATHTLVASESPLVDARVLLSYVLKKAPTYLFTWPEKPLTKAQQDQFVELVQQRVLGTPIAYLTGHKAFWSLQLAVNSSTLIPRPETELLVETALTLDLPKDAKVCDLGTGTGAIAIALAVERRKWAITGIDRIDAAIDLAKQNANHNGAVAINWLVSHWFSALPAHTTFDLIVSNPPYVENNSAYLQQGDVRFEPMSALTSGRDGLDDLRLIIDQAPTWLSANSWLLLEHGCEQHLAVTELLLERGFADCEVVNDLQGLPRVSLGKWVG